MHGSPRPHASRPPGIGLSIASWLAFLWGWALGRGRVHKHGDLWVHAGLPTWAYGRGGTCVGTCLLTTSEPGQALIRHEQIHVEQWRRHGLTFPLRYWLAGLSPEKNRFEVEAGLKDGGYTSAPSRKMR